MKTILDVSNIVYGGHYASPDMRISGFPMGGIRKLFGILNAEMPLTDFVLCFDGGISFRRELEPEYKAGRVPNYSVMAQVDLLREMLLDCDIPFYREDDYEADDLICSTVYFLDCVGDREAVTVYSDDRDMACCVNSQTSIRNVTSQGICINKANYETRVVKNERIPYNTILLYKMLFGDRSDNYSELNVPGVRFSDVAATMLREMQPYLDSGAFPEVSFMDVDIIRLIIDGLPDSVSLESKELLKKRAMVVYPRLKDITANGREAFLQDAATSGEPLYRVERRHIKIFGQGEYNQRKFDMYCNMLNLNRCRMDRLRSNDLAQMDAFKQKLKLMAKDLSNGVYAVEKSRANRAPRTAPTVIENMRLPI